MDKPNATETNTATIASQGGQASPDDAEARLTKLETEKENYRQAYLKEVDKNKKAREEGTMTEEEEKMANVARKVLTDMQVTGIDREKEALLEKTLKENKELKLAHLNKNGPPAAMGTHSETVAVMDGTISPEQMAYFKNTLKWDDKTIASYKANLRKKV